MKKILVVSATFWPEESPRSYRTTELVLELKRRGFEIDLLLPQINDEAKQFIHKNKLHGYEYGPLTFESIQIFKKGLIGKVLYRLAYQFFDFPMIEHYFKLKKNCVNLNQYEIVISIAMPHAIHWAIASIINKNKNFVWIADCGDPYMGITLESFKKPFYFKYFEQSFCRKADYITVPVPGAIEGYYPEFHEKIKIIPQGFDFSKIQKGTYHKTKDYPVFAYAGSVATKGVRSLLPVFTFLKKYNKPFEFHIYSKFAESYYKSYLEHLGIADRVFFHGHLNRTSLLKELCTYDFLINLDNGTPMQAPSKLIDYAFTERPILNLNPRDFSEMLFFDFLKGNYVSSFKGMDIEEFKIAKVVDKFESLL